MRETKHIVISILILLKLNLFASSIDIIKKDHEIILSVPTMMDTGYHIQETNDMVDWYSIGDRSMGPKTHKINISKKAQSSFYRLLTWEMEDEEIIIAIVGDSTVADLESNDFKFCGWGEAFPYIFNSNATVINFALAGLSTRNFLGGVDGKGADSYWLNLLKRVKPHFVLMQFGIIDKTSKVPNKLTTIEEYKINYEILINEIRNFGGTPIILSPVNRAVFDQNNQLVPWMGDRALAGQEVSTQHNVHFIDLNKITGKLYQELGPNGVSSVIAEGDKVHYSIEGAEVISKLIANCLPSYLKYFLEE